MSQKLIYRANITPATAPMEVSYDGGTTFVALAFATVGSLQEATLANVPAATYAIGKIVMRAVGYPATTVSNAAALTVAAAVSGYEVFYLGDSRSVYPGNTGTIATTSLAALATKRFADAGHADITFQQQGYPGWNAVEILTATGDNPNIPNGGKATGQTAVQHLLAIRNLAKTTVVVIMAGANATNNNTAADIGALADALRAGGVTKIIAAPILNRLDQYAAPGIPNLPAINAQIIALQGTKTDETSRTDAISEIYALDAPNDPAFFWMNDAVGLSKVHLTTLGNVLQSEQDCLAVARLLGLVLPENPALRAVTYTGLSANEAYSTVAGVAYLRKVGGTDDWNAGAQATVLLNQPADKETLVLSLSEPRGVPGSIYGLTNAFTRSGFGFLTNAFYYEPSQYGVLENGGFAKSPAAKLAGKPSIRITRNGSAYGVEYRIGATLVYTSANTALTFPLYVACSLFSTGTSATGASEAPPALAIGLSLA